MNAALDLHRLARDLGGEVSGGQIRAPGPGHSPKDRSLSVMPDPGAAEGFVVNSFADDDPLACRDYVRSRCGLPEWKPGGQVPRVNEKMATKGRVIATFEYQDADGKPYGRVRRKEPKSFYQQRWNGSAWVSGAPSVKVPYRLPEILAAVHDVVMICEGEKDADALTDQRFVATTATEGAGKWTPDLNQWFEGKTVYVLPDNDAPGEKHAAMVAANLHGIAREVRIVRLPGLPDKGDVSDYIAASGTADLIDLCKKAPLFSPNDPALPHLMLADNAKPARRTEFTADELWDMEFPAVSWIVPDYITPGLTLLVGAPKLGKSWLALDICRAVAEGGFVLGDRHCQQGAVLYAALEDNPRRLKDRLHKVCGRKPGKAFSVWTEMPVLDDGGLERLRDWITAADAPRLIVIDVLNRVRSPQGKGEAPYQYDYRVVTPLKNLADEFEIAIVVVHHTRKAEASDALEAVSGTNGLTGAADTTIVLLRDGEGVKLTGRGRDIAEFETALVFQKDNCRWRVLGDAAEVRRSDERKGILDALRDADEPMSSGEIADVSGQSNGNVRRLLGKMVRAGEVIKAGRGRYLCSGANPGNSGNNGNKEGGEE